jgi:hypothetical protein
MNKLLIPFILVLLPYFTIGQIKYFTQSRTPDSLTGIGAIKNYEGKIFGLADATHGSFNISQKVTVLDGSNGKIIKSKFIDSIVSKRAIVQGYNTLIAYNQLYQVGTIWDYGHHKLSGFYKFDTAGNTVKIKELLFNYPSDFTNICQSVDGNLFACGSAYTDTNSSYLITDGLIAKLDTGGNVIWRYYYLGAYTNTAFGMVATADSGVLVSLGSGPNMSTPIVIKLDKHGTKQWEQVLPFVTGFSSTYILDYDPMKKEYVFCTSYALKSHISKLDSNFNIVWDDSIRINLRHA